MNKKAIDLDFRFDDDNKISHILLIIAKQI